MGQAAAIGVGLGITTAVIVAQAILPFAFDFVSTAAVYAVGVWVGRRG